MKVAQQMKEGAGRHWCRKDQKEKKETEKEKHEKALASVRPERNLRPDRLILVEEVENQGPKAAKDHQPIHRDCRDGIHEN